MESDLKEKCVEVNKDIEKLEELASSDWQIDNAKLCDFLTVFRKATRDTFQIHEVPSHKEKNKYIKYEIENAFPSEIFSQSEKKALFKMEEDRVFLASAEHDLDELKNVAKHISSYIPVMRSLVNKFDFEHRDYYNGMGSL